jgi:hypothetical protein
LKAARKVVLYFLLTVGVVAAGLTGSIFIFKDRIIQQFIREANKALSTPVKIEKIEVSAWRDFPHIAVVLKNVYVEDSHPGTYPLLTAKLISFSLNTWEVWQGKYSIRGMLVTESETNLKINADGKTNYVVTKKMDAGGGSLHFDLKDVKLKNAVVHFIDQSASQHHVFASDNLAASVSAANTQYEITAQGDITTRQIKIKRDVFLKEKRFDISALLMYDDGKKLLTIKPSEVSINRSRFAVNGTYQFAEKNWIDISTEGKETNIQTIINLFPEPVVKRLRAYQSEGDVYFNLRLKGEVSNAKSPALDITFGCQGATVYHPDYKTKITAANLKGSFSTPSLVRFSRASLSLRDITGLLNGKPFQSQLRVDNFDNPFVDFQFTGDVDASALKTFYPLPQIEDLEGQIKANVSLTGEVNLLRKKATAQRVRTNGSITLTDIRCIYGKHKLAVKDLNGTLQFSNNDLALSGVRAKLGHSDFLLNGFFKNVITYLLFEKQPVGIEADLLSNYMDLDQLFEIGFGQSASDEYRFRISPEVNLNFNCSVGKIKFKRFTAHSLTGDLLVKNEMAVSRNISFRAMGGRLSLNGIVDAQNSQAIDLVSAFKIKDVHMDSVFYVFENFKQHFIEDRHLKGQATADISLEMTLNENLSMKPETLIADISTVIKNGELNDFEPMQKLNKYLDENDLNRLRFADLKNDIHIENSTIYIPQMEIKSNATTIQLSGTHTFDQQIDYRIAAPFRNKKKIDPDEVFGAVEDDGKGPVTIFLKITGTTDNYEVRLDKEAVKKKIASDLRKEVEELKDAFKSKGKKKKKELELEEDNYFDWEENL